MMDVSCDICGNARSRTMRLNAIAVGQVDVHQNRLIPSNDRAQVQRIAYRIGKISGKPGLPQLLRATPARYRDHPHRAICAARRVWHRDRGRDWRHDPSRVAGRKRSSPPVGQYHQIQVGGDKAALMGVCKALFELDDAAQKEKRPVPIDRAFIAEHTHGFEEFEACVRGHNWAELEIGSGLSRAAMEAAATVYAQAKSAIVGYGMGMTQHVNGVENVQKVTNLLRMRGNIGKPGAGGLPDPGPLQRSRPADGGHQPRSPISFPTTSLRSYTASSRQKRKASLARKQQKPS